uniref:BED-type domain-containing protein n=1 Tax=Chenopodium quinoa TaxID=63459 RepID=A0A803MUJ8_CHEQI
MEDSSATSQAPPIPSPPPEPWEYEPMTENNDPFVQQNQSNQPFEDADVAAPSGETSKKKSRKRRSPHWEHFIKKDGENKAECIYCHELIGCASLHGTSGMKNHISRCRLELWKFNQEDSRKALEKMVIMDEMSFRTVEHEVMQTLNEMYELYVSENPLNDSIPPKTSDFLEEVEDMDSDVDVAELEFEKDVGSSVGVQGKNDSLSTKMVEALICAQDWLRTSQGPLILEERLEDMEKIESEMLPLGEEQSLFVDDD